MSPTASTQTAPVLRVVGDVPVEILTRADTVADVAGTYARMVGELDAMVRAEAIRSANAHAAISTSLRELEDGLRALVEVLV